MRIVLQSGFSKNVSVSKSSIRNIDWLSFASKGIAGSLIVASAFAATAFAEDTSQPQPQAQSQSPQSQVQSQSQEQVQTQSPVQRQTQAQAQAQSPSPPDSQSSPALQGKIERKHSPGFSLFGKRWTSEVYRSLNYGILGVVMVKHPFSKTERVGEVFPDCPAALAGIRPGDVVVSYADHVIDGHETQRSTWHTADGVAGTHVDYVVRRHGRELKFDLTRMNIEDIKNNRIRRIYERMLSNLGPPGEVQVKLMEKQSAE